MSSDAVRDYSIGGPSARAAVEAGLVAAEWYHPDIPRKEIKLLMQRRDWPAVRDTLLWFALLAATAAGGIYFYGSWIAVPFFLSYGVLYGTASDSRWHECAHSTPFRTQWMNRALYQVGSFMIMREAEAWRWSHARHHSDTLIVGRDPEITVKRPPNLVLLALAFIPVIGTAKACVTMVRHSLGQLTTDEQDYIPVVAHHHVFWAARVWLALHVGSIALAVWLASWIPVLLFGMLPTIYGSWLFRYFAYTNHTALAENVLDHRLNARTVYVNPILAFIYWNTNYHLEHHLFPMVPYHALPKLHELVKHDTPPAYPSLFAAYREIVPAVLRQVKDPEYYVRRQLPAAAKPYRPELHDLAFVSRPAN